MMQAPHLTENKINVSLGRPDTASVSSQLSFKNV